MMLRLTMAARITLIIVVGLTAVWLAAITAFYVWHADVQANGRPSPGRIKALAELIETADPVRRPMILQASAGDGFQLVLADDGASPASRNDSFLSGAVFEDYLQALGGRPLSIKSVVTPTRIPWPQRLAPRALEFRVVLATGQSLVIDTGHQSVFNRAGVPVGFGAGFFGTLVAIAALLVMQRETKPLARLAAAVDRIELSADPVPLADSRRSAPEIRAVLAAFNRLQSRLGGMLQARMALIGGISHDVRTFATRLRLRVDGIPDVTERQRAVTDIEDMIRLLDDAVVSSWTGARELSQEMVEFAAVVAQEVEDRQSIGAKVDWAAGVGTAEVVVLGDRLALRRIVANLVENALKFGLVAHLRLDIQGCFVLLTVDDEGPGVPRQAREFILEPFSRLEASRSRTTGGAGLGLSIVRGLVEAHGGDVGIGETPHGGCRVTVLLPIFVQSAGGD